MVADKNEAADPENPSAEELLKTQPATAADSTPAAVAADAHAQEVFDVKSDEYLAQPLTASSAALVDADNNGVMMKWETNIMKESVEELQITPGKRVLNVGFGMGIFDGMVQEKLQGEGQHTIIEAHPDVIKSMRENGASCNRL